MNREVHVRFCESRGLQCSRLLGKLEKTAPRRQPTDVTTTPQDLDRDAHRTPLAQERRRLTLEERNWLLHMLQEFAARDEVRGVVLDLDGDSGLDEEYQQWDRHKTCAPAANIVAEAIHDLVGAYRHADPKALEYLTIVGSDAAVPFRRVPDHAAGMPENNHNPPVMDLSENRASFARGYVLTQDYYGSSSAVARQEHDMYVPGVAVGRAGESVEDIVAL